MISFLHTGEVHVATFDRLMDELAPGMPRRHRVEQGWLDEARDQGMSDRLRDTIRTGMAELASEGVGVCTCSSIGGAAEAAASADAPVVRIDRALMEAALEHGKRPLVAMCLESTRAPTMDLLADVATRTGISIEPQVVMCESAWTHFEAGDMTRYANVIADAVRPVVEAGKPDCVVLAQASMAPAEPLLKELGLPVLSSPRLGVLKALKLVRPE
jgi:Asp/Glu/hydantoin racemase